MYSQLVSAMMLQCERDLLPIFAEHGRLVDEAMAGRHHLSASHIRRLRQAFGGTLVKTGAWLQGAPAVGQAGAGDDPMAVAPLGWR